MNMNELTEMFGEPISVYTWQDAVNDGTFVEVTGIAKNFGYIYPIAFTRTFYNRFAEGMSNLDSDNRIMSILLRVASVIKGRPSDDFPIFFELDGESCMVATEGRSMENPEPILTVMLGSDY